MLVVMKFEKDKIQIVIFGKTMEIHEVPRSWDLNQIKRFVEGDEETQP